MTPTKITTSLEKFYEARKNEAEREAVGLFNLANIFYDELSIQFSMLGLNLNDYFRDDLDYFDFDNRCVRFSLKNNQGSLSIYPRNKEGDYRVVLWLWNGFEGSEFTNWAVDILVSAVADKVKESIGNE